MREVQIPVRYYLRKNIADEWLTLAWRPKLYRDSSLCFQSGDRCRSTFDTFVPTTVQISTDTLHTLKFNCLDLDISVGVLRIVMLVGVCDVRPLFKHHIDQTCGSKKRSLSLVCPIKWAVW